MTGDVQSQYFVSDRQLPQVSHFRFFPPTFGGEAPVQWQMRILPSHTEQNSTPSFRNMTGDVQSQYFVSDRHLPQVSHFQFSLPTFGGEAPEQ